MWARAGGGRVKGLLYSEGFCPFGNESSISELIFRTQSLRYGVFQSWLLALGKLGLKPVHIFPRRDIDGLES